MEKKPLPIYTLDIETDPFKHGRYPEAFSVGFYDGEDFVYFWGSDCLDKMYEFLRYREPGIIYAHNGGRFDIYYFLKWIAGNTATIISSRIIKALMPCAGGHHEFRDSFAIMPFALKKAKGKVQKKEIDIAKLERSCRNKHRTEIVEYLKFDCMTLWDLVTDFLSRFGDNLTIGSTAMKQILKLHTFGKLNAEKDAELRADFFYGGRVQCFQKGVLRGNWKVFDVNSMYPHAMKSYLHPTGRPSHISSKIRKDTCFLTVTGENRGAFPQRTKSGGITFDVKYGTFHVSIHEWNVAKKYGLFVCDRVERCINFDERGNFQTFVDTFYNKRKEARSILDENGAMFYKFILNSGYGKFAQNPDNYEDWMITQRGAGIPGGDWRPKNILRGSKSTDDEYVIWSKKAPNTNRFNVATGASITGAARSVLMEALATAINPIYCDTDSIICEDLPNVAVDGSELGAWKLEAEAQVAAIAGKKLYALLDGDPIRCARRKAEAQANNTKLEYVGAAQKVKQANKGVSVTPAEIVRIAQGETVHTFRDAPSFRLNGTHAFISRKVRMT